MSKRGSNNSKQRRRGSSPVSKTTPDPFVNGQIPACRELLTAIQDVFPELHTSKNGQDSSAFGKLLRWHYLEKRNAKQMPPPPPLALADRNESETSANAKKKKKRKKKKKGGAGENNGASNQQHQEALEAMAETNAASSDDNKSIDPFEAVNGKTQSRPQSRRGSGVSLDPFEALNGKTHSHPQSRRGSLATSSRRGSLNNDDNHLHDSGYFFDQIQPQNSTQELLSPTQFIKQIRPETMPGLPSLDDDDEPSSSHHQEDALFSPTQFLKQMPKETSSSPLPTLDIDSADEDDINKESTTTAAAAATNKNGDKSSPRTPRKSPGSNSAAAQGTPSQAETDKSSTLNSPNHEWVPEEKSESQQETAPGDAIKDPLTLPYLMIFSEGSGTITTKTIDGSLVSAALPTYQEPSRMETTKVLFQEWLGQLNNDDLVASEPGVANRDPKKDLASFVDFLQARTHGQPQQVGIPFEQLQSACSNIKSYTCRQTATTEVEKLRSSRTKMVVLDASCLQEETKAQTTMSVDAAFDYVALEEGHHTPLKDNTKDNDPLENVDLTKSVSFVLSPASDGSTTAPPNGNNNQYLYIRELSAQHLDTLTEEWLPCGIEEDVMVTTVIKDGGSDSGLIALSTEELEQIQKQVTVKERALKQGLAHAESSKTALYEQLENKSSFGGSSQLLNIDFNSFPQLQRCDRQCGELMDGCFEVLRVLSKENTHALADLQMQFWTTCLMALNKVLKSAKNYYEKIEHHADQNGSLPKIFVSADLRELYRELLDEKRTAWTDVCNKYERGMSKRALREYYTRTSWYEFKSQSKTKPNRLDEKCFELLDHLVNWTDTILGRRMSDIYKTRIGQTNQVLELLQKVVDPLTEQYETVERFFSSERNVYFANLRSQIVLVRSVKKQMRLLDQDEVESMVMGVLLMWRQTRIMQSRMVQSQAIPPLPLQLKKWMLQDDIDSDVWKWDSPPETSIPITRHMNYPLGAGGKRRAMCVLAGLVYQWLGDRYKEWQAEVAEQELLTDFVAETEKPAVTNGESKSAKKKKKKRKKSGAVSPSRQPLERATSTASADTESGDESFTKALDEALKGTVKEAAPEPEVIISSTAPVAVKPMNWAEIDSDEEEGFIVVGQPAEEPPVAVAEAPVEESPVEEPAVLEQTVKEAPVEEAPVEEAPMEDAPVEEPPFKEEEEEEGIPFSDIDNYQSAVRIRGRRKEMSASDFLIARMEELLAGTDDGKKVVIV
ncbi:unnamed protein product [Cylindrotheca closterium]|uniref:Uncharacterized protein n=1 Tax=Cylindrotheca closterium TaxID=2856 RepID=A0AAD2JMD8_9STRA|nr:unnamed protein product [Cylindrotheca closterium]